MAKRIALAGVLTRSAPDGARLIEWRTDLFVPGSTTSALAFEDLDRPGLSIAEELDCAAIRAVRASDRFMRSARG